MAALAHRRAPLRALAFSFFLACAVALISTASALQFRVGGARGWHKPTGNDTETYNEWARRNRFHIGDSAYFKYNENDSVLVVDHVDYSRCNASNPLQKFEGSDSTTFKFNRHGFFYFISGQPGHCSAGQKLAIRVMVHPLRATSPQPAPAPGGGSGGPVWGPGPSSSPTASSSFKLRIDLSAVMAALVVALGASSLLV